MKYCREPSDFTWVVGLAEFSGVPQTRGMTLNYMLCCLGAYSLVRDIAYTTDTDFKVRLLQCFELSVIRSINRVHWNIGEGTDDIVLWGLMGKFMI